VTLGEATERRAASLQMFEAYRYPTEGQGALFTKAVVLRIRFSKSRSNVHSNVWRSSTSLCSVVHHSETHCSSQWQQQR
jgi:hypothetical protein